jgi:P27 family predicted phage terminase small subunit
MPAPRKSAELHALQGTKPNGRAADVSHCLPGKPKVPNDLDAALKPTFKRLCALLAERRVLTAGDAEMIRLYCFQLDRHKRNVAMLRQEGEICTYTRLDSNGQPHDVVKANARMKIVADTERQMAAILSALGLTPAAKDRAKPTRVAEEEKKAQLFPMPAPTTEFVFPKLSPEDLASMGEEPAPDPDELGPDESEEDSDEIA